MAKNEKEDVAFRRLVEETAKECGVRFGSGALEYLAGKIGAHPRMGVEETRKLASYLGAEGGEITEQMIIDMVPTLGKEISLKHQKHSFQENWTGQWMRLIDIFFRKDARPLLATLQNQSRLLIQLRVLVDGGRIGPKPAIGKRPT